ncbi:uncharacterized protein LOC114255341 [Monomorium pharaonis]|uniref:uncharacterized protein LOC114255341 n=1 Tax=Monomorium pharaonis TaxID=307658 RepID=UPI00102E15F0|nr:uncharacterized protein LOC114255341 [Monomorium pharaonis]
MVSRRTKKRKCTIFPNDSKQKNFHEHGTINYSESQLHEHPYETRSKSSKSKIETTTLKSLVPSRRPSNDSVIYLGSFHKSPQLVTLEDSNESSSEKVVHPEAWTLESRKVTYI